MRIARAWCTGWALAGMTIAIWTWGHWWSWLAWAGSVAGALGSAAASSAITPKISAAPVPTPDELEQLGRHMY